MRKKCKISTMLRHDDEKNVQKHLQNTTKFSSCYGKTQKKTSKMARFEAKPLIYVTPCYAMLRGMLRLKTA